MRQKGIALGKKFITFKNSEIKTEMKTLFDFKWLFGLFFQDYYFKIVISNFYT